MNLADDEMAKAHPAVNNALHKAWLCQFKTPMKGDAERDKRSRAIGACASFALQEGAECAGVPARPAYAGAAHV